MEPNLMYQVTITTDNDAYINQYDDYAGLTDDLHWIIDRDVTRRVLIIKIPDKSLATRRLMFFTKETK